MNELWEQIPQCPSYEVSSTGYVRRSDTKSILSGAIDQDGFMFVCVLSRDNKRKTFKLHRLIASLFLPNPDKLPCVAFKNGDKLQCHVGNLVWAKRSDVLRARRAGKTPKNSGHRHYNAKLSPEAVREIRTSFLSAQELAAKHKVSVSAIRHVRQRTTWKSLEGNDAKAAQIV